MSHEIQTGANDPLTYIKISNKVIIDKTFLLKLDCNIRHLSRNVIQENLVDIEYRVIVDLSVILCKTSKFVILKACGQILTGYISKNNDFHVK